MPPRPTCLFKYFKMMKNHFHTLIDAIATLYITQIIPSKDLQKVVHYIKKHYEQGIPASVKKDSVKISELYRKASHKEADHGWNAQCHFSPLLCSGFHEARKPFRFWGLVWVYFGVLGLFASFAQWEVLESYFPKSPHNLDWEKQLPSAQYWSEIVISIWQYLKVCSEWKARETKDKPHTNLEISKFNSDSSATVKKQRVSVVFYPLTSVALIILAIFRWETSQRNQQPWRQQL